MLDAGAIESLVAAGSTLRWRAALALAGYAGLRLGEIRALTWGDVDLDAGGGWARGGRWPSERCGRCSL